MFAHEEWSTFTVETCDLLSTNRSEEKAGFRAEKAGDWSGLSLVKHRK